jgi:hypothetical protein
MSPPWQLLRESTRFIRGYTTAMTTTPDSSTTSSIIEVGSLDSAAAVIFDSPEDSPIDALQADGGDMILLGTSGGRVHLQMVGACGGCPLSSMTLTAGIERILRDRVPGVEEIVAT